MKHIILILICLSFLCTDILQAADHWILKAGPSYTIPLKEKNYDHKMEYNVGLGKQFKVYHNLYLQPEIRYVRKSFVLRDRIIVPIEGASNIVDVYSWDIHVETSFIELPVFLKYKIRIMKHFSLIPQIGLVLSFPYKDYSSVKKLNFAYSYETPGYDKEFDNSFSEDNDVFKMNNIILLPQAGLELKWRRFSIEFVYFLDNREEFYVSSLHPFKGEMSNYLFNFILYI